MKGRGGGGCYSEIFILSPKGDQSERGPGFFFTLTRDHTETKANKKT